MWATPSIQAVKDAYPQARVSVLLREGMGSLLSADPAIYKIFEAKNHKNDGFFRTVTDNLGFIASLRREKFSVVIDLRADERGAFNAYLTGAPYRAAMFYRGVSFFRNHLFTHLVDPFPPDDDGTPGAARQSLRIIRAFGIREKTCVPRLYMADGMEERVQRLLTENIAASVQWISLNPFSRWEYKEWRRDKWAALIDWLWDEYSLAAVIVGSEGEKGRADEIRRACRGMVYNLAGRTTLAELAGLLRLSRLHIGVDSAAPHIAAAMGTPTVTIYGPSDWRDWAPVGEKHTVIVSPMDCVPCRQKGCDDKGISKCLEELAVEDVQDGVREMLTRIKDQAL
ncbi:MAG: glycosyltransferase family 9 protein [Deltaproteobacteria bacterium]|nr:glycosyltransferase family 9 protein [Deltaproteobacteria bacterium]